MLSFSIEAGVRCALRNRKGTPLSRPKLLAKLRLPAIGAPMFIVSAPRLVIAQCKAGIVGSFPSLSARTPEQLDAWLGEIKASLDEHDSRNPEIRAAPFAVNLIVHRTNSRLETDLALCAKHRVPMLVTSLGAREEIYAGAHDFGAIVFHDVVSDKFGRKAIAKGADALVAVASGAGGHAGSQSPFALIGELRRWFNGPIALAGSIATGDAILAAEAMGADFAYIGSPFIATDEAQAADEYKAMIVSGQADDILYTDFFSGISANYLKPSITRAGLDVNNLIRDTARELSFAKGGAKAWRDVWGSGQGIGALDAVLPAADYIQRLEREYREARARIGLD